MRYSSAKSFLASGLLCGLLFSYVPAEATVYDVSGIPEKNTGDALTASEVNLIVDMLRNVKKDDRGDTDDTNDRVGIGIAGTPGYMLDVNGTVNAAAFRGDGSQLTNLPNPGVWQITANDIYYNTGKVAIGINSSPTYELEIHATADSDVQINAGGTGNNASLRLKNDSQEWIIRNNGGAGDNFQITNATSGNTIMDVDSTSNHVTIAEELIVGDDITTTGTVYAAEFYDSDTGAPIGDGVGLWEEGAENDEIYFDADNVGIGMANPAYPLHVSGDVKLDDHLAVGSGASINTDRVAYINQDFSTDDDNYLLMVQGTASGGTTGNKNFRGGYIDVETSQTEGGGNNYAEGIYTRARTSGSATFNSIRGLNATAFNDSNAGAGIGSVVGIRGEAYNNDDTGTVSAAYGAYAVARGKGSLPAGAVTNLYGTYGQAAAYESAITNAYGAYNYARTINGDGGDIGTAYGSYNRVNVDSDDGGDITTGYGVYANLDGRSGSTEFTTATGVYSDVNNAVTAYGGRFYADDPAANLNYGIVVGASGATNNYGIYGTDGDWVLDADGDGGVGGTGSDLIIGESSDLRIYHDGTDSVIDNRTGDLALLNSGSGNIGIGTSSPIAPLSVVGSGSLVTLGGEDYNLTLSATTTDNGPGLIAGAASTGDSFIVSNQDGSDLILANNFAGVGSAEAVRVTASGAIGVGDAIPDGTLKLDVEGQIGATQYCDEDGANCTAAADLGGGLWSENGGDVYYNSGYVGIGTDNPLSKLMVLEPGATQEAFTLSSGVTDKAIGIQGAGAAYFLGRDVTNNIEFIMGTSSSGVAFAGSLTDHDLQFRTGNTARMTIDDGTGSIGIGTISPSEELYLTKSQTDPTTMVIHNPSTTSGANVRSGATLRADGAQWDMMLYGTGATGTLSGSSKSDAAYLRTTTGGPVSSLNIGNGGSAPIHFFTGDARQVTIASDGKVGIGTDNPTSKLTILDTVSDSGFNLNTPNTRIYQSYVGGQSRLVIGEKNGGTGTAALFLNGDDGDVAGSDYSSITHSGSTGKLTLATTSGGGAWTAADIILMPTSKVGIGTSSPDEKLHISSTAANMALTDTDTGADAYILTNSAVGGMQIVADYNDEVAGSYLDLRVDGASNGFRITETGAVGLGDNTPDGTLKLDIEGPMGATEYCDADGNNCITAGTIASGGGGKWLDGVGANEIYYSAANVGIGTNNPSTLLHTYNATINNQALFESGDATTNVGISDSTGSIILSARNSGSLQINVGGNAGTMGTSASSALYIEGGTKEVGIGTNTPAEELHVLKSQANPTTIVAGNTSSSTDTNTRAGFTAASNGAQIDVMAYSSGATGTMGGQNKADAAIIRTGSTLAASRLNIGTGSAVPLNFFTNDVTRMTIAGSGEVSINSSNPEAKSFIVEASDNAHFISFDDEAADVGVLRLNAIQAGEANQISMRNVGDNEGLSMRQSVIGGKNQLQIGNDLGSTDFIFDVTDGEIGIGISSPNVALDVAGTIEATSHIKAGVGSGGVAMTVNDGYGNANLTFNHFEGKAEQNGNAGRIEVNTDSTTNGVMYFEVGTGLTSGASTALTNVMTLEANGNVGIGVTNPAEMLHVQGSAPTLRLTDTSTGADNYVSGNSGVGGVAIQADINSEVVGSYVDLSVDGSTVLRAKEGGTVGIGDTTPDGTLKLDVEGPVGATQYCDENGANCTAASDLGGGKWLDGASANEIYYSAADVGIGTNAPTKSLDIAGSGLNIDIANSSWDVWIQGGGSGSGGSRNLALLGADEDSGDYLTLNYGGEYSNGTRIPSNTSIGANFAPAEELHVRKDQANPTTIVAANASNSTDANTRAGFTAASNGAQLDIMAYSTGATGSIGGQNRADAAVIRTGSSSAASRLNIGTGSANDVNLFTNDVTRLTIQSDGDIDTNENTIYLRDVSGSLYGMGYNVYGGAGTTLFSDTDITFTESDGDKVAVRFDVNNTQVGIGGDPAETLHIQDDAANILLTDTDTGADAAVASNSGVGGLALQADLNSEVVGSYVDLSVDGSTVLRAKENGTVGIGTLSFATEAKLAISGGAIRLDSGGDPDGGWISEADLGGIGLVGNIARVDTPDLYVTNDGDVGIGNPVPRSALDVYGSGNYLSVGLDNSEPGLKLGENSNVGGGADLWMESSGLISAEDNMFLNIDSNNDSTTNYFAVLDNANTNAGTELFRVETSGDVGIGTAGNAESMLHISGSNANLQITDTDTGADSMILTNSTVGGMIISADQNNEVANSYLDFFVDGSRGARLTTSGDFGIGDASPDGTLKLDVEGQIGATEYCDQNGANCTAAADLGGGKWLDGAAANEIYYSAADVGIGTNAPATRLHVSDSGASEVMRLQRTGSSADVSIRFINDTNSMFAGISNAEEFGIGTSNNIDTALLTVERNGEVGIGTVNPVEELQVFKSQANPTTIAVGNTSTSTDTNTRAGFTAASDGAQLDMMVYGTGATGTIGGVNKADSAFIRTGTTLAPANLNIGTGAANSLSFFTDDTTRMIINNAGKFGIGTGVTSARMSMVSNGDDVLNLDLTGASADTVLQLDSSDGTIAAGSNFISATDGAKEVFAMNGNGNTVIEASGTIGGSNMASAWLRLGDTSTGLGFDPNEIYGIGQDLNFGVMGNRELSIRTNGSSRIQVEGNGEVGMGTTNPAEELQVVRSLGNQPVTIAVGNTSTGTGTDTRAGFAAAANEGQIDMYHYSAGATGTTAGVNRADAAFIRTASGSPSSSLNIGNGGSAPLNLFTTDVVRMTVEAGGDVGIGVANPSEKLEVAGTVRAAAFLQSSDRRLKQNIKTVENPLDVLNLRGVSFDWKDSGEGDYGFIAQEMEAIYPELVSTNPETGLKAVSYSGMNAVLLEALKAQQAQIEKLSERLESLEKTQKQN